jgi:hypothetical protein
MHKVLISILGILVVSACSDDTESYSDPLSDARNAISKHDFTLLAFSSRAISLPGIDLAKFDLAMLEKRCGYHILPNSGDMLKPGEDLTQRKKMRAYATEYNQAVMEACLKKRDA